MKKVSYLTHSFEVGSLQAHQVMEDEVKSVNESASCEDAASYMISFGIGCLPVVDNEDKLKGMLTEYDLLKFVQNGGDLEKGHLSDAMSKEVLTLSPETGMNKIFEALETKHHLRVPVVDNRGKLVGVISRRDILFAVMKSNDIYFKLP